jgi:superfamily II DNA or RNA helicase
MEKKFTNLHLKISYDSGEDNILRDFYIPVLSLATRYDRIAGFFSSSSLALCARGMSNFISNNGKMRLITCPELSTKDVEMLEKSVKDLNSIITDNFIENYDQIENKFQKDHVKALGWMLANNKLEMKIAIVKRNGRILNSEEISKSGIMHQKVGVLYDSYGNIISFSGSNNESANGWRGNTEEFKVFSSWNHGLDYIDSDINKFGSFWNNSRKDVSMMGIPEALNGHLIDFGKDYDSSLLSANKYYPQSYLTQKQPLNLFFFQRNAVDLWEQNDRKLLLQMATGTGKTRTAIGCMDKVLKDTKKLVIIIACPQVTLASQWAKEIKGIDIDVKYSMEINGGVCHWKQTLKENLLKVSTGMFKHLIIFTTHSIIRSERFTDEIKSCNPKITKFLIADEVHGLGATKNKLALLDLYKYRLGLSATPERWFDENGSKLLKNYFGNRSFEFSINDALTNYNPNTGKTFLVNYYYKPTFINLSEEELLNYKEITKKIVRMSPFAKKENLEECLQLLRIQRANIEKNAEFKYQALEEILKKIKKKIDDTIIFVSPQQIDRVMEILADLDISASKFTEKQSAVPSSIYGGISEREHIIKLFKKQKFKVLVAIKCLDEGIDIPSARRAIIMASSTNPREYIQRIGRIIRQDKGKYKAELYDLIIKPKVDNFGDESMIKLEKQIFKKEMDRVLELSNNAINNSDVLTLVDSIQRAK